MGELTQETGEGNPGDGDRGPRWQPGPDVEGHRPRPRRAQEEGTEFTWCTPTTGGLSRHCEFGMNRKHLHHQRQATSSSTDARGGQERRGSSIHTAAEFGGRALGWQ